MRTSIMMLGFAGIALLAGECGVQAASMDRYDQIIEEAHEMMNFERFKTRFGKVYGALEDLARKGVSLGRL
jgi:hypothetical protein